MNCGNGMDRDPNVARNILAPGLDRLQPDLKCTHQDSKTASVAALLTA